MPEQPLGPTTSERALIELCFANGIHFSWRGRGALLIPRRGIEQVLELLRRAGFTILGFEGFKVHGQWIAPRMDLIVDLSGEGRWADDPYQAVVNWGPDIWIYITTDDGPLEAPNA